MPLDTTHNEMLVVIKGKKFVYYTPLMKSIVNIGNPYKLCLFHHNHGHDTKKFHTLKKDIKRLMFKGFSKEIYEDRDET
jgi:hypothetical protein